MSNSTNMAYPSCFSTSKAVRSSISPIFSGHWKIPSTGWITDTKQQESPDHTSTSTISSKRRIFQNVIALAYLKILNYIPQKEDKCSYRLNPHFLKTLLGREEPKTNRKASAATITATTTTVITIAATITLGPTPIIPNFNFDKEPSRNPMTIRMKTQAQNRTPRNRTSHHLTNYSKNSSTRSPPQTSRTHQEYLTAASKPKNGMATTSKWYKV